MPVAFLLGADWEDCFVVGKLFGMKTFLNEFVAYEDMKPYIENRLNGTFAKYDMDGNIRFMSVSLYSFLCEVLLQDFCLISLSYIFALCTVPRDWLWALCIIVIGILLYVYRFRMLQIYTVSVSF